MATSTCGVQERLVNEVESISRLRVQALNRKVLLDGTQPVPCSLFPSQMANRNHLFPNDDHLGDPASVLRGKGRVVKREASRVCKLTQSTHDALRLEEAT